MHRRSSEQDILTALINTCALLAYNDSCLIFYKYGNQVQFAYAVESAYFLLIFSFHLLDELLHANHSPYSSQQSLYATLASTFLTWIRQVVRYISFYISDLRLCNTALLPKFFSLCNALQYVLFLMRNQFRH